MKTKRLISIAIGVIFMAGCNISVTPSHTQSIIGNSSYNSQLKTVTTSAAILTNVITNNNNGMYQILNHWNNTGIITYYDFSTMRKVVLSSDIANAYTKESTAYLDSVLGGVIPIVANDSLYIVKQGSKVLADVSSAQEGKAKITKMKLNGTEKKELFISTKTNIDNFSSFLADDMGGLYTLTYDIGESIDDLTINLTRFGVDKNSIETIFSFDDYKNLRIIGSTENEIVIQSMLLDDNGNITTNLELLKFNIDTKNIVKIVEFNVKNTDFILYQDYIYYSDKANLTLNKLEIKTLKNDVILENDSINKIKLYEIFDNKIIASTSDENLNVNYFGVDFNGKVFPLTHFYKKDEGFSFMGIVGETDKDFIVKTENINVDYTMKNSEGNINVIEMPVLNFALIDKDDYWDDIHNYRCFTDEIEYCNVPQK